MDARYRCFCSVLMHLQVRGASCRERVGVCEGYVIVLMHLQVRGASCPWLWNRRHDATSRTQSATGPASTPQDRPAPGADYHISLQSRQAPPTTPTPPPANNFRRHHAEKPGSKQGPKSRRARRTQAPTLPVVENEQPSAQPPSPSPGTNHGTNRSRRGNEPISGRNTTDLDERPADRLPSAPCRVGR